MLTQYTDAEIEKFVKTELTSYSKELEDIHKKCRNDGINLNNPRALNFSEQVIVFAYSRDVYWKINQALRNDVHTNFTKSFAEMLSQTMDKLATVNSTVYRKEEMELSRFNEIEQKLKLNKNYEVKSFYSTSKSLSAVYKALTSPPSNALFQIKCINPKDIEPYSYFNGVFGNPNEEEVLFKPGSAFEIIAAQKKPDPKNNYQYKITLMQII